MNAEEVGRYQRLDILKICGLSKRRSRGVKGNIHHASDSSISTWPRHVSHVSAKHIGVTHPVWMMSFLYLILRASIGFVLGYH